jgi:hypothetical protein
MIRERQYPVADDLAAFMTLAGDEQRVPRFERGDGAADRLAAIPDLRRADGAREDFGADTRRYFAARVVVGDDDAVGIVNRDRAHDRPLAAVAVAAAAEHHDEATLGVGAQRFQGLGQRIGLVGVVDEDRRAVLLTDKLQAPFGAGEMLDCREGCGGFGAGCNGQPCGDQRVLDLKLSNERQAQAMTAAR